MEKVEGGKGKGGRGKGEGERAIGEFDSSRLASALYVSLIIGLTQRNRVSTRNQEMLTRELYEETRFLTSDA